MRYLVKKGREILLEAGIELLQLNKGDRLWVDGDYLQVKYKTIDYEEEEVVIEIKHL